MREVHRLNLTINKKNINKVIIDEHYKEKHPDIKVETILKLVKLLDGKRYTGGKTGPFSYFKSEMELKQKLYRLVWMLEDDKLYVGVVNVFRINKRS